MPRVAPGPSRRLQQVAARIEAFEASPSIARTGTGSRREGRAFEDLIGEFWSALGDQHERAGAVGAEVSDSSPRHWMRWSRQDRDLYLPLRLQRQPDAQQVEPSNWFRTEFPVDELIAAYPGRSDAGRRWAPTSGSFSGERYPLIYSGLSTIFDDTVVLVSAGVLREKILLEYKSAKSSGKRQIDGNAHERLSFQIMQDLEVATRYPRCTLEVVANGAFVRYRNKYHVNFHVQAERLTAFGWFAMQHRCTARETVGLATGLADWLLAGADRRKAEQR